RRSAACEPVNGAARIPESVMLPGGSSRSECPGIDCRAKRVLLNREGNPMDQGRIVVNGTEYRSLAEVPDEYRELLASQVKRLEIVHVNGVTVYRVNGQEYRTWEEVPAVSRAFFEQCTRGNLVQTGLQGAGSMRCPTCSRSIVADEAGRFPPWCPG